MARPVAEAAAPVSPAPLEDFILLAEFDEIEGPRPLMTIPPSISPAFRQDEFVVRIMAVDYQSSIHAGARFAVAADTQVMMLEPVSGAYTYVHHFTLYDMRARGFVRPYCLAFVTLHPDKIMKDFESLRDDFSRVCDLFKFSNLRHFHTDLTHHRQDLLHTLDSLRAATAQGSPGGDQAALAAAADGGFGDSSGGGAAGHDNGHGDGAAPRDPVATLTRMLADNAFLLAQVVPHLAAPRLARTYAQEEQRQAAEAAALGSIAAGAGAEASPARPWAAPEAAPSGVPTRFRSNSVRSGLSALTLGSSPDTRARPAGLAHVASAASLSALAAAPTAAVLAAGPPRAPKVIDPHANRDFDTYLRTLRELCPVLHDCAFRQLEKLWRHYMRPDVVLTLELLESQLLQRPTHLLTVGRCVVLNFYVPMSDVDETQFPTPPASTAVPRAQRTLAFDGAGGGGSPSAPGAMPVGPGGRRGGGVGGVGGGGGGGSSSHGGNSTGGGGGGDSPNMDLFDTEYLLATSPFSQSIYMDALDGEGAMSPMPPAAMAAAGAGAGDTDDSDFATPPHSLTGPPVVTVRRSVDDYAPAAAAEVLAEARRRRQEQQQRRRRRSPAAAALGSGDGGGDDDDDGGGGANNSGDNSDSDGGAGDPSPGRGRPEDAFDAGSPLTFAAKLRGATPAGGGAPPRVLGLLDETRRRFPFQSFADHVHHPAEKKPGGGVLALLAHHSYSAALVYALLAGRPVVVLASPKHEDAVRALVKTLWLFVPGTSLREQVVPWQSHAALALADLGRVKLIGLSRKIPHVVPKVVERYVSVLDYDQDMFTSPAYTGTMVTNLLGGTNRKEWESEALLLAHIHRCILGMAQHAFLYYHAFCLKYTKDLALLPEERQRFLASLDVTDACDQEIVVYFAEVVKMQQVAALACLNGATHEPAPTIVLRHATCVAHKNRRSSVRTT